MNRETRHGLLALLCYAVLATGCSGAGARESSGVQTGHDRPIAVRPGIEVLLSDSVHLVRGRRIGLVTNQAGVDARGRSDVERMLDADLTLVALFSPEHGFRGMADPGEAVASSVDAATGLPIYSLYGRTSAPTDSMLAGLERIVIDLQDAGARYYTYLHTTTEVMRAAARRGLPVIILDRPNPIGGSVQGNVLDPAFATPVGLLAMPMRHGLTLGEQARLAANDLGINADLHVVPVAGWRRGSYWDDTALPFVPPSPNLRSVESLVHYPGTCLFEGTNLSVGRGSSEPFSQVGSPWLDTTRVLAAFRQAGLPGVQAEGVRFVPRAPGDGKYADTTLAGIRLRVTDRGSYDPTITAVTLLSIIERLHAGEFRFLERHFDRLAGTDRLRRAIEAGTSPEDITRSWRPQRDQFLARVQPFLIYGALAPGEGQDN